MVLGLTIRVLVEQEVLVEHLVHLDQLDQQAVMVVDHQWISQLLPTNGSSGSAGGASGKSIQGVSNVTSSGSGSLTGGTA